MRPGTPVRVRLEDGTVVKGQVWAETPVEGAVWLALDDGRYARLTSTGHVTVLAGRGRDEQQGVAA